MQTFSARSLAPGKPAELAREQIAQAAVADIALLSMDDSSYPPRLKAIYDPPLILRVRGNPEVLSRPGIAMAGSAIPRRMIRAWPSAWRAISLPKDWSLLVA